MDLPGDHNERQLCKCYVLMFWCKKPVKYRYNTLWPQTTEMDINETVSLLFPIGSDYNPAWSDAGEILGLITSDFDLIKLSIFHAWRADSIGRVWEIPVRISQWFRWWCWFSIMSWMHDCDIKRCSKPHCVCEHGLSITLFPPDCQSYLDPDSGASHGHFDLPSDFQVL